MITNTIAVITALSMVFMPVDLTEYGLLLVLIALASLA